MQHIEHVLELFYMGNKLPPEIVQLILEFGDIIHVRTSSIHWVCFS